MPYYIFENEETGEQKDIFFGMNDKKEYKGENGKEKWKRIYTAPRASNTSRLDAYEKPADFVNNIANKKGTYGDLLDLSKEVSERRAQKSKDGKDPVKEKYFKEWSKKRSGKIHPQSKPKKISKNGITFEF